MYVTFVCLLFRYWTRLSTRVAELQKFLLLFWYKSEDMIQC